MRSPVRSTIGPALSITGLPGLPRQVNSTLRLTFSSSGTTCDSASRSSEYEWSRVRAIRRSPRTR